MKPFHTTPGSPLPFGNTRTKSGFNFAIFSRHGEAVSLIFFESGKADIYTEISLDPLVNRTGDVWHIEIHDLDPALRYCYRVNGPWDPDNSGHRFSVDHLLLDPYAKALSGSSVWGESYRREGDTDLPDTFRRRCCLVDDDFDWEGDRPLNRPLQDSVI